MAEVHDNNNNINVAVIEDDVDAAKAENDAKMTGPSRKDRPTGSTHFGDSDFEVEDEVGDATWAEVYQTCCCHSPEEWGWIVLGLFCVFLLLYFFLFALELLGSGAKVMSGCKAGALFGDDTNPVAGLMVGILATVLLQSSSTTTSIIVSLVGDSISVAQGIYMVMGANIGTSVTNTIVAIGQMGDEDQLERAFAGATVHDMFNFLTVAVLFPLEIITGYLDALTGAMVKNASVRDDETWEGPIKKFVAPLTDHVIISNKEVTKKIAEGTKTCEDFYPMNCEGKPTYDSCGGNSSSFGLIMCDKKTKDCPAFFAEHATVKDDKVSGGVVFFLSIMILFVCLLGLVTILQKMLLGMSTRIVYKATDVNGYMAITIGAAITILVQSSSITTSTLTPLVGMGALRLEQMFPLTLGANVGTTVTGLLASMVSDSIESLQVALAHLFFNVTGIIIWYPIPFMRQVPLNAARRLGKATRVWRGFPFVYIIFMFVLLPLVFLGISALFQEDTKGFKVLGSFIVIVLVLGLVYLVYWCRYRNGQKKCHACMIQRERKRVAMQQLPNDMEFLKARVAALTEHTGLVVDDADENVNKNVELDEVDA